MRAVITVADAETVSLGLQGACRPVRPCLSEPGTFASREDAIAAAQLCDMCPIASECLLEALRFDGAHRAGRDLFGISGCCGGVWFEPGRMPARIPRPVRGGVRP